MKLQDLPDIHEIGNQIDIPTENWPGRCYEIAGKIVDTQIISGRTVYGHYLGYVAEESMFADRLGLPFIQHGWIVHETNMIVDPTRWVFEAEEPYIFIDLFSENTDQYDEGGNVWRASQIRPPPVFCDDHPVVEHKTLDTTACWFVFSLLGCPPKITKNHAFWLANLPPDILKPYVRDVYQWLIEMDLIGFIPIDNRIRYIGRA